MATKNANEELCAGCFRHNEEEISDLWCNDCAEPVCRPCGKAHKRFATPHDVIDIKYVSSISRSVPKNCLLHTEEKNILFCAKHDKIICRLCLSESHKECNDITKIEKAALGIKETTFIHQLKEKIKTLTESVENVQRANEARLNNVDDEKEKADNHLKLLRECVNGHMTKIEKVLSSNYDQIKTQIADDGKHIGELGQTLPIYLNEIDTVVEKSSEIHLFHVLKHLQAMQISEESKIKQIKERVHLHLDAIPDGFVKTVDDTFKTVENRKAITGSNINLKESQVQKTDISNHSDIQPIIKSDTDKSFGACCFTEVNNIVVIENKKDTLGKVIESNLKIYDGYGNYQAIVHLSFIACDVCMSNALVTEKSRNRIVVVNVSSLKQVRSITLKAGDYNFGSPKYCLAILCSNGNIWALINFEGFKIHKEYFERICQVDFNGQISNVISPPSGVCDICFDGNRRFFMTNNMRNDITYTMFDSCTCDFHKSIDLREGCKLIITGNNIFLLEKETETVYKLDITSGIRRVVEKGGVPNPSHFCFNSKTARLAIVMDYGKTIKILIRMI